LEQVADHTTEIINALDKKPAVLGHSTGGLLAQMLAGRGLSELYDTFHVAGSGISLVQMGNANLNPWTEAKVNTANPGRGPLLIIDGEKDHTVPWAIANAAYKRQRRNPAVTEIVKMLNRGHSLTIDHGWREVAQTALDFVKRFA
jgi:pimeloyl-ACP methyl ester carboxylesterase